MSTRRLPDHCLGSELTSHSPEGQRATRTVPHAPATPRTPSGPPTHSPQSQRARYPGPPQVSGCRQGRGRRHSACPLPPQPCAEQKPQPISPSTRARALGLPHGHRWQGSRMSGGASGTRPGTSPKLAPSPSTAPEDRSPLPVGPQRAPPPRSPTGCFRDSKPSPRDAAMLWPDKWGLSFLG